MRKLKNKIKNNFRKNVTKAAIIAAAGFGVMAVTVPAFADEMHHCSCGENHDDPNCKCGCQEAKALVELTKGEWETSQKDLNSKREVQKQLEEVLEAAKKAHEEYQAALQKQIDENLQKAQDAYDEAKALLDAANATSDEAGKELDDAAAAYEEAQKALEEAENLLAELEASNPDIEKEYEADLAELEQAEKELEQAIEDEEKAQAEKEAADKAAEEAKQKREAAREAREKARQAAEDAEKRKADAEAAKKAADEAQADAQGKYDEADAAYSYKKGLADGTIPIESTPEWEEAQKTQAALDAAISDKEKADGELQKAEEDLAEKEKALEDANADLEEKSKVCEETREKLKAAKEELETAQKENADDKKALEKAQKEKEDADKEVEDKQKEVEEADNALEEAKKAKEDAQKAVDEAEKDKKNAEEELQKHKDEKRNFVAYLEWDLVKEEERIAGGAESSKKSRDDILMALDAYYNMPEKLKGYTDLTDENDASNIDMVHEAIKFINESNKLRAIEETDPETGEVLYPFEISHTLMMQAILQLNWSDNEENHSKAFNVAENLAWGQHNTADLEEDLAVTDNQIAGPFGSWYTKEKKIYDENGKVSGTGHYLNIVSSNYTKTGFAVNKKSDRYGWSYGQTFNSEPYWYAHMSAKDEWKNESGEDAYDNYNTYEWELRWYIDVINEEQEEIQKKIDDAKKTIEDSNAAIEQADQDIIENTNKKSASEEALAEAEQNQADATKTLEEATTKEETSAKRVEDAETALGLRTQENETAEEELTTAQEAQEEAQTQADAASGAKEEKKKEADKKNETFTEAKNADDKVDQIVQDLLDGKEVPALEGAKNEAGVALDKANENQASADKELKDAGDDLKAKNDDLNKKTAEEETAEKEKNEKEADAKNKNDALNTAKNKKADAENKRDAAQAKADDAKNRLDNINAARDGKADAAKTADGAKANKDAAQKKADEAKANLGTVTTQADEAKAVLDEAMKLDVSTVIAHPDEYDTFADEINALNKAIQDEDAAGKNYTAAENDCVVAEADEQEKKGAYDDAVAKNAMAHEHCGHDEHMEASYRCTAGDGNEWTKGAKATSDFTFERSMEDETTFGRFKGIKIDGKDVGAANYTTASGSVVVKLKPEYLETLTVGEHTIMAEFDDGSASAKFSVKAAAEVKPAVTPQNTTPSQPAVTTVTSAPVTAAAPVVVQTAKSAPATGDRNGNVWIVTAAVTGAAAAVMAGAVIYRRKKG